MIRTVAVNGKAVEDYLLQPIALTEWLSAPQMTYGSLSLVERMGLVATAAGTVYQPRKLSLGIRATQSTMSLARAGLNAWYQDAQGLLEVEVVDAPGRVCYGYFEAATGDVDGIKLLSPSLTSIGTITCYDPFWYDRSPTSFGAAANTRILVPAGSAPSNIRVQLCGPFTDPIFILRTRSGSEIARMTFTDTVADATAFYDLDFERFQIDRYISGVRSAVNNGYDFLDENDTFLVIDPLDAPTLEVTSGSFVGLAWRSYLV